MNAEHDRWRDEVAAYMLGAMEPGESGEFERHLAECPDCRAELQWLSPALQTLPDAVERVDPSPDLRDRVLAQVRAEAPTEASPARRAAPARTSWLRGWRPLAGVATLAVVILAAVLVVQGGDSGGEPTETTIAVAGKPPGVRAKIISEGNSKSATLQLTGVKSMQEDRVLEAWTQRNGVVRPVRGLFVPDRDGRASTRIPNLDGVEAVMVTAEPRGGSERPTATPLVTAKIERG